MRGVSYDAGLFKYFQAVVQQGRELFQMLARPGLTVVGGEQRNDQYDRHDDITSSAFDDAVNARSGNDYIKDFGGADTYNGGPGDDTVTYDEWVYFDPIRSTGINADLAAGRVRGPDGRTDRLIDVDHLRGEDGADRFVFRTNAFGEDRIEDFDGGEGDRIEIAEAERLSDLAIRKDDGDTRIRLDGDSVVVLEGYDGPVAAYLIF